MNGAEVLLQTLIDNGVEVCFANPGTSEMQLVAAIDKIPGMRPVLGLFEGVVTGAADGYGRMADKPAATLLHLGSGFSNGMANLHNARRAHTPIVNIVGDHASYHLPLDAPLTSDVPGHALLASSWVRVCSSADQLAEDGAEAIAAAKAGRAATLVVPADYAWSEAKGAVARAMPSPPAATSAQALSQAVEAISKGASTCIMLGGKTLREEGLALAHRLSCASGVSIISEVFPARIQRGRGRIAPQRLAYFGESAAEQLQNFDTIILLGAKAPVSFFAYPGKPSTLWPENCQLLELASATDDVVGTLHELVKAIDAPVVPTPADPPLPEIPEGPLTAEAVGAVLANALPANAVVSDESNTAGAFSYGMFDAAQPHDWLTLTGGAIGQGLPLAVGAAVACPQRKIVSLQADGSAMYTNQALWTMVREKLDICVVLFKNNSYAILNLELLRVGVENPGQRALSMLDLSNPELDWVSLANGMGLSASRSSSVAEFQEQFNEAMSKQGPQLIEVVL